MSSKHCIKAPFTVTVCLLLMMALGACETTALNHTEQPAPQRMLLDDLVQDDGFAFQQTQWFMSKADFFAISGMDEKTSVRETQVLESGTLEIVYDKKTIAYTEPAITGWPVLYFSDGMLTMVRLSAEFASERVFLACAADLKAVLDKNLTPKYGSTDFLTQSPPVDGSGLGDARWEGSDKSGMEISTFYHKKTESAAEKYIIVITLGPGKDQ